MPLRARIILSRPPVFVPLPRGSPGPVFSPELQHYYSLSVASIDGTSMSVAHAKLLRLMDIAATTRQGLAV